MAKAEIVRSYEIGSGEPIEGMLEPPKPWPAPTGTDTRPSHYQRYDPEPITVIEAWGLGFALGNVLKYIVRAAHKGAEIRDLRKALWYLQRHIDVREAQLAGREAPKPGDQA